MGLLWVLYLIALAVGSFYIGAAMAKDSLTPWRRD